MVGNPTEREHRWCSILGQAGNPITPGATTLSLPDRHKLLKHKIYVIKCFPSLGLALSMQISPCMTAKRGGNRMGLRAVAKIAVLACLLGSWPKWVMAQNLSPAHRVYMSCIKAGHGEAECERRTRAFQQPIIDREQQEFEKRQSEWEKVWQRKRQEEKREREFERQAEEQAREQARKQHLESQRKAREEQMRLLESQRKAREEQMRLLELAIEAKKLQQQQREEQLRQEQLVEDVIHHRRLEQLEANKVYIEQQKVNELRRPRDTLCWTVGNVTECRSR